MASRAWPRQGDAATTALLRTVAIVILAVGAMAGALAWRRLAAVALAGGLPLLFLVAWSAARAPRIIKTSSTSSLSGAVLSGNACVTGGAAGNESFQWQEVRPPLPEQVQALLRVTRLGYLSTAQTDSGAATTPHLSLMNFTYVPGDEVIIMTTRKDTQKFQNLLSMPRVAMLVHDFPTARGAEDSDSGRYSRTYSITLYGVVRLAADQEEEQRYRMLHLENNPSSRNFIVGDNIVVLVVNVECARLCNSEDKVTTWSAVEAAKASEAV